MKGVRAPVYAQTFNNAILFGTERFCDRNINIKVNRWCFSSILLLIYFRSFIRSMFEQYFPQESIFHNILVKHKYTRVFVSGCISGLVVSLIDTPFDLVKTQLQNQGSASQTSWFYRYLHECRILKNYVLKWCTLTASITYWRNLRSHLRCWTQRTSNGFNEFQNDKETLWIQRTSRAVPSEKTNHSIILTSQYNVE